MGAPFGSQMSMAEAVDVLVRSTFTGGCWTTHDESLEPLQVAPLKHDRSLPADFVSHDVYTLPDQLSQTQETTAVHRFVLHPERAALLNHHLTMEAQQQRRASPGIQITNVNGWHSREEPFEPHASGRWYSELRQALQAALQHLALDTRQVPISGWLNSSGPEGFNALHDHGRDVAWSMVYFVRTGEETAPPNDVHSADDASNSRGSRVRISQSFFDVVSRENCETFGMDEWTAASAAVDQLQAQGVRTDHLQFRLLHHAIGLQSKAAAYKSSGAGIGSTSKAGVASDWSSAQAVESEPRPLPCMPSAKADAVGSCHDMIAGGSLILKTVLQSENAGQPRFGYFPIGVHSYWNSRLFVPSEPTTIMDKGSSLLTGRMFQNCRSQHLSRATSGRFPGTCRTVCYHGS